MIRIHFFTLIFIFTCASIYAQFELPDSPEPKFSISAGFGSGLRTAPVSDALSAKERDHTRGLLSGLTLFVMPRLKLNESYSIGVNYRYFRASKTTDNLGINTEGDVINHLNEVSKIHFVGPSLHYHSITQSGELNAFVSLGYIGLVSDQEINRAFEWTVTGGSFGMDLGVEYLWSLNKKLYFGGSFSYTVGSLGKIKIDAPNIGEAETDLEEREGLQYLSIGPIIRWYL
jgi:hypothetical protein